MRKIGDGTLSLEQATALINSAQAAADKSKKPFSGCYSLAKTAFEAKHDLHRGFWVPKAKK